MKNRKVPYLVMGIFSLVFLTALGCRINNDEEEAELNCIGEADPNALCIEIFDPVCGCNGVTYSNSCFAEVAGVLEYVPGECN